MSNPDEVSRSEPQGTVITLDNVTSRRTEILRLADQHGVSNLRVVGTILQRPVQPSEMVGFVVEFDAGRRHGVDYYTFAEELAQALQHLVAVRRSDAGDELTEQSLPL